ncbi:MAG: GNAT family N-acetyltransferase [Pseudomonadota bacterium]
MEQHALRSAELADYPFVEAIYLNSMGTMLKQLGCWDENYRRGAFHRAYRRSEASIITLAGRDIGWMQISERDFDINLAQIQILDPYCGKGIGTALIRDLMERAGQRGKSVSLSAVRANRAIDLYQRLGFKIINPDATPIIDMVYEPQLPN